MSTAKKTKSSIGSGHKLDMQMAIEIRKKHKEGQSIGSLAREYRLATNNIVKVIQEKSYRPEFTFYLGDELCAALSGLPIDVIISELKKVIHKQLDAVKKAVTP